MAEHTSPIRQITIPLQDYGEIPENFINLNENISTMQNTVDDSAEQEIIDWREEIYELLNSPTKDNQIIILKGNEVNSKIGEEEDNHIVRHYGDKYSVGPYVGFLQMRIRNVDCTIIIRSRFDNVKSYFTNYILEKALGMNSRIFPDMSVRMSQERVMQSLLAIVFMQQIKEAYKKGLFRQYRTYENNNMKVRGKIDISRHIKENPLFNGKISYSYREYTADNDINRIIFTAFTMLYKKNKQLMNELIKRNHSVGDCMKQLQNITSSASRQEIQHLLNKNTKKIHHSIYKDWENVRKTAIMILKNMGIGINEEQDKKVSGVLIHMPNTWEGYLESVFHENGMDFAAQKTMSILFEQEPKKDAVKGKREFRLDFYDQEHGEVVLDAKYKKSWSVITEAKATTGRDDWKDVREDIFQVLSYMYVMKANIGGILSPVRLNVKADKDAVSDTLDKIDNEGKGFYINSTLPSARFHLLPIIIPETTENEDYNSFAKRMKLSEEVLVEYMKKYLTL